MHQADPPPGFPVGSVGIFERNLQALSATQPELHRRLSFGANLESVSTDAAGRVLLERRGARFPLALEGRAAEGVALTLERPDARVSPVEVHVGVGLGEMLGRPRTPACAAIVAWERDPGLLLLALASRDVAEDLNTGRLRFALGTDLLEYCQDGRPAAAVAHPLLGSVYERERKLLEQGPTGPFVALAEGRLFVDQVGDCLRRIGFSPFTIDLTGTAAEELEYQLRRLAPRFLFGINLLPGAAEFAQALGIPYVVWEIDPSTDRIPSVTGPVDRSRIHTYRRAHVEEYLAAGYSNVTHTPLAADTGSRRPVALTAEDRPRFEAPLAFVGASMVARGRDCRSAFLARHRAWANEKGQGSEGAEGALEQVLREQRADPWRYRIPELLRSDFGEFLDDHERVAVPAGELVRPELLVAEVAAAEKRLNTVASLAPHRPVVWGDEGWRALEPHGVEFRGGAGHATELDRIYSNAGINLDVGRIYQSDIVTMRVFDVLACGGFAVVERSDDLASLFAVGEELVAYSDGAELQAVVAEFGSDPDRRSAIAKRGLAAVRERHAMEARLAEILAPFAPA